MKSSNKSLGYHLVAFLVIAVWGSTFVFTKMLLQNGLSPAHIFTLRFIVAYVLLLPCSRWLGEKTWMTKSWRDELLMVLLGLTGGSMYFLTENAAMLYTTATNTSLIVCACPLFAMLLFALTDRHEHFSRVQVAGSLMACAGMAVVVLNGHFVLHLSPLGDLLAFSACLCWAVYSLLMKSAVRRYSILLVTRKVFFYGLLTMLPYYLIVPGFPAVDVLLRPQVLYNLLFLSVIASMLCFLLWNWVMSKLGIVIATNWVYFNPITTIIFAAWLLHEPITLWFLLGTVLILWGMYLCDRKKI